MMPTPASTPDTDKYDLFAVCLPGLEPWLAEELQALSMAQLRALCKQRGVKCPRKKVDAVQAIVASY